VEAQPASSSAVPDAATGAVPPAFEPLHHQIEETMRRLRIPGVALGILYEGQQHVTGFGVTNVDVPGPVIPETLFQIGSITKTVTATAIMRLVEMGALDLDTPIRAYLPDLALADASVAERVTLRHLLTHTSGWEGDLVLTINTGRGDDALARLIARMPELEQVTPIGSVWSYNNAGFDLAGRVIEVVTGKPYETVATELVLRPLGLTNAYYFPEDVMLHSFAVGHNVTDEATQVARPWPIPRNNNAAGGISTTAGNLLRYARFVMGDGRTPEGEPFLASETLELMRTQQVKVEENRSVGLAWFNLEIGGVRFLSHDGGTIGQIARLICAPAQGFALVLLTNATRGGELTLETTRWALKRYLGVAEPEPVYQERAVEQLAEYAGRYVTPLTIVEISVNDGRLILSERDSDKVREFFDNPPPPDPPVAVAFAGPDLIIATEGPMKDALKGEFLRDSDGKIVWLRIGGRVHQREG
jgi:CubicO group peptidase (beta-lactamase class C family)